MGFLVALALGLAAAPAAAQAPAAEQPFADAIAGWSRGLDEAKQELSRPGLSETEFEDVRVRVEKVRNEALAAWREAQKRVKETSGLLAALGPAPGEAAPPESADVADQRRKLQEQLAAVEGRLRQADLVATQASNLLGEFLAARRSRLAERLLVGGPPPLRPWVWARAVPEFLAIAFGFAKVPVEWLASAVLVRYGLGTLAILAAGLSAAVLIGWPLRKWLLRRFGRDPMVTAPSYVRRVVAAVVEGVARGLLPSLAVGAAYGTLLGLGLLTGPIAPMARGVCLALVFFVLVSSFVRAALAPDTPNWRLAPFSAKNAATISRTITALAGVAALGILFEQAVGQATVSVELQSVFNLVLNSIMAVGVLWLLRGRLWQPAYAEDEDVLAAAGEVAAAHPELLKVRSRLWPSLRVLMALAALTIPVSALFGYYRLSGYLASNLVWTGVLIGGLWLLRELVREVVELLLTRDERLSPIVRRALTLSEGGARVAQFWVLLGVNLLLVLVGLMLALPIWDVSWEDFSSWLQTSVLGFSLDRLALSLGDFGLALLVFVLVLVATRWFQRALEERILPQTRLEIGARHSLKAGVGYIGLVIAAVAAVTMLGLDLTNLAIVAGALSVGIGFGLQNIVNNFVSGLILLIERPVKVGDLVIVGEKEGIVRRISVRATEILTFQRASVIIPNSEFLSSAVVNWTHKDRLGRIDIPVGVAYGSDTAKVREILLRCAAENPDALRSPEPQALFQDFGGSALEFELRVFVGNIENRWRTGSALRFAIDKAFREAGIEIPFLQTDIHLRDLDRLERVLGTGRGGDPGGTGEPEAGGPAAGTGGTSPPSGPAG